MALRKNVFAFVSDDPVQDVTTTNTYWNGKTSRITVNGALTVKVSVYADADSNEHDPLIVAGQLVVVTNRATTGDTTLEVTSSIGNDDTETITVPPGDSATVMYLGFENGFVLLGQVAA